MIKRLGFVDINKGWIWCREIEKLMNYERWNGKVNSSGRKCIWYGKGVDLGFKNNIYEGLKINNGLRKRGDELWGGNDWNSILVYKYERGCELKDHRDRKVFDDKVVLINFCKLLVGFKYGGKVYWLKDGEVIEFNNKVDHGVIKVNNERFSLSFRKVF